MNKLILQIGVLLFLFSITMKAQSSQEKKANIAFVLRGYDNGCFFCDTNSFDVHAQLIVDKIGDLSFGRISSYEILDGGIDERSPIFLQSLRDIDVFQAALDGWTASQWQWVQNFQDFWLQVPAEFVPVIEELLSWMKETQLDFNSWGQTTEIGKEHYWLFQTNVQRMGSSAASDFLLDLRMPENYNPVEYDVTIVILHSDGANQLLGGGLASSLPYFGVLDSNGNPYSEQYPVAYVGATPFNSSFYSIAIHEAIHTFGMGTHDQDPNGLLNGSYSIMQNASLNNINSLPAWNRYYWTNWLPKETITIDSTSVKDLNEKVELSDTINKYILEVIPGDELGRGGTYRELFDGKWYTYEVDNGGSLSFTSPFDNEHLVPVNYLLAVPKSVLPGEKVIFRIYSDGQQAVLNDWKKDGVVVSSSESNEFIINQVDSDDEGLYEVVISNAHGSIQTHGIYVTVECDRPEAPEIFLNNEGYLVSNTANNTWFLDGMELGSNEAMILPALSGTYSVLTTINGCKSDHSEGHVFVLSSILEFEKRDFVKLFPNPFQDQFILDFQVENVLKIDLQIFDLKGVKVFEAKGLNSGARINLGHIPNGFYFTRISNAEIDPLFSLTVVKMQ